MAESTSNTKDNCNGEYIPSRKLGAFDFMADHLFDLVLIIKNADDEPSVVRRVELYYAERQMISSFVFDRTSKKYTADSRKAMHAALEQLMKEVKSRALSHQKFTVWYYTESDRDVIEMHAKQFVQGSRTMNRYLQSLISNAKIIPDTALHAGK